MKSNPILIIPIFYVGTDIVSDFNRHICPIHVKNMYFSLDDKLNSTHYYDLEFFYQIPLEIAKILFESLKEYTI